MGRYYALRISQVSDRRARETAKRLVSTAQFMYMAYVSSINSGTRARTAGSCIIKRRGFQPKFRNPIYAVLQQQAQS